MGEWLTRRLWLVWCVVGGIVAAIYPLLTLTEPVTEAATTLSRGRLVVLAVSSLIAPLLLLGQGLARAEHLDRLAVGVVVGVLFVLVVVRMAGLVGKVQSQADQLSELAMRDDLTGLPNRPCWRS
ncbi:hypothetical protein [Dactylosporangium sp. NPDC049140]|uniref:hypothetical protein n=1 Tax=Dactylosporangium sp. NPDC049140 TaxID=3155647 RepID=UPI0033E61109